MAVCSSLKHAYHKSLPDNPTLIESLSPWKQVRSIKSIDESSFSEILKDLHFNESSHCSSPFHRSSRASSFSSNSLFSEYTPKKDEKDEISSVHHEKLKSPVSRYCNNNNNHKHSNSFSSINSDSLSICTEDLGFESCGNFEDILGNDISNDLQNQEIRKSHRRNISMESHWKSTSKGAFPPPISCIGRSGKPWVYFKSYKQDGRFILKEIRIPTQEFMRASRKNGRLKLHFIHSESDDDFVEDDEEDDESVEENNGDARDKDCVDGKSECKGNGENVETRN